MILFDYIMYSFPLVYPWYLILDTYTLRVSTSLGVYYRLRVGIVYSRWLRVPDTDTFSTEYLIHTESGYLFVYSTFTVYLLRVLICLYLFYWVYWYKGTKYCKILSRVTRLVCPFSSNTQVQVVISTCILYTCSTSTSNKKQLEFGIQMMLY